MVSSKASKPHHPTSVASGNVTEGLITDLFQGVSSVDVLTDVFELLKKSVKALREGGFPLLKKRGTHYTRKSLLFTPDVPPLSFSYKTNTVSIGYSDKYIYTDTEPQVVPKPSDTVVEAGVYPGKQTATFAKMADRVFAFEPSPRNYAVAKENLRKFDNVQVINEGLWDEESELEIQYGKSGGDDGFLAPDKESREVGEHVPVNSLENYREQLDIGTVDFLKIEAEGAEPEIIEGIDSMDIENIVVNADEERDGEPVGREVMELLQPKGYNLVAIKDGHILFFTRNSVPHYAFRNDII